MCRVIKKLFKSKIDRYSQEKNEEEMRKQRILDRMHEKNSAIETKLKKWENKAQDNKKVADRKIKECERRIDKLVRAIQSEQIYVNSIADNETTTYIQDMKRKK